MAAAGLSTLLVSAATAPMFMVQRLARIVAVCLRALAESKAFTVSPVKKTTPGCCSLPSLLCVTINSLLEVIPFPLKLPVL